MDDDFWHNPHQGHYEVGGDTMLVAHHGQGPGGSHDEGLHLGLGKHDAFAYSDSIDVAPSLVNQPMTLMPLASAPSFSSDVDSYLDDEIESSEGESPAGIAPLSTSPISSSPLSNSLLSSSITPTPMLVAPQSPAALTYRVEIVVVDDEAPYTPVSSAIVYAPPGTQRVTIITPTYISAADNGFYASLVAAAAMQRRVDAQSYGYGSPSRLGSLNAMSEDTASGAGKSLESTLQSTSASLLATLGTGNGVFSASAHISTADDESGTNEQALSQNAASRPTGDESDGIIELSAADLASQKRKLAATIESHMPVQTRLEQLADIPVIHVGESLFRELLVHYENSSPTASQQSAQVVGQPDDGMIELLAADVGSVASRHAAIPVTDHSQPVTAESGIALYQSLEIAGLDDIAEVAAAVQSQAAPVAPIEQIARGE